MKAGIRVTVLAVLSAVLLMSVLGDAGEIAQDQTAKSFAMSSNDFGFRLLEELRKVDDTSNVFISPASIMLALAMTYNGSAGTTQFEMQNVLALQGMSIDSVNAAAKRIMGWLEDADTSIQLAIANSIWKKDGFPFREPFIQMTRDYYDSDVYPLTTAPEINNWVADKTNDKIKKIIDTITPDDIMFLINAIYFKGEWTDRFDEHATRDRDFNLISGQVIKHPLMDIRGDFSYWEDSDLQAITLPYGDRAFSMVVLLPRNGFGIQQLLDSLSAETWQAIRAHQWEREGHLELPKFTIEYEASLKRQLSEMGMEKAFQEEGADFSNMWYPKPDSNVYIGDVLHKTYVKVNEKGTEAAAVTVVEMKLMETAAVMHESPFEMIVDRPFVCAIVDQQTGMILFVGAIFDPREDE